MASELPTLSHAHPHCHLPNLLCLRRAIHCIGGIAGGRVTNDVSPSSSPVANSLTGVPSFSLESKFYDVGPAIEIGLGQRFAVEFDAIYHRQGFFTAFYHDTLYYTDGERDNSWEFPVLLKYKLRSSALSPFVQAGVAPRTIGGRVVGTFQTYGYSLSPPYPTHNSVSYSPSVGFVAGAGLQLDLGHLRLAPQARYTRWGTAPVSGLYNSIYSTYSSNQNQLDLLIGITWKVK